MLEKQSTKSVRGGKRENAGRPAGVPNKLSSSVKDNVTQVFEDIGGLVFMADWAKQNPNQFFNIYSKLLPLQVNGSGEDGEFIHKVVLEFIDATQNS